jgi:hypothetical protein
MTISVDTDGDGKPDAVFPIKWALLLISSAITIIGAGLI